MAKPRIEVQIAAEVGNALNGLKRATEAINQFKAAAGAAGGRITVSLGNAAKSAGTAARKIETEFSDSFAEIDAAIRASGVTAGNWSQQVTKEAKQAAQAVAITGKQIGSSLDRAAKSLQQGFGRGIIHPSIQADLAKVSGQLQLVSTNAQRATGSLVGVGRQGASAIRGGTSAAISFGHIIQDLPYGINGVANNITQLTTQMGYMAASAKAAGVSMKTALIQSIANPATLAVLGMSAITTAIVYFTGRVGKAKKETDELGESVRDLGFFMREAEKDTANEIISLRTLRGIAENANAPLKARLDAVKSLKEEYPEFLKGYSDEELLTGKAADAYIKLASALSAVAIARANEKEAQEIASQRIDTERALAESLEERIKLQREIAGFNFTARGEAGLAARRSEFDALNRRLQSLNDRIESQTVKLRQQSLQIKSFSQDAIDALGKAEGAYERFVGAGDDTDAAKRLKEQQKEAEKLAAALKKASEEAFLASLPAQDKATEKIRLKYAELKQLAGLSKDDIIRLNNEEAAEIAASNAKFDAKRLADQAKFQEKLAELQRKSFLAGLPDEDAATERIRQQFDKIEAETKAAYDELLVLADGNDAAITALNEWYSQRRIEIANDEAAAIAKANAEATEKRLSEERRRNEAARKAQEKAMRDMTNLQEEWARTLSRQLEGVLFEGENIFEAIGSAFKRMISQMIADALAADLASALFSGKGGGIGGFLGGLFGGKGGGIGGFLGGLFGGKGGGIGGLLNFGNAGGPLFKMGGGLFPFADGGIVSGPTMGLIGEYPGAKSNPEVIAPLSDLTRMLDFSGGANRIIVEGQISNDVIYLSNQRGARNNKRFFGNGVGN